MAGKRILLLVALVAFCTRSMGQEVAAAVLGKVVKTYTSKGMKLEKTYAPDPKNAGKNSLFQTEPCYVGKTVTVVALTAAQPKEWFFKVRYNDQLTNKDKEPAAITIDGKNYWRSEISVFAPAPTMHNSDKCLTILAYDKTNMYLPVYVLVLTR